MTSGEFGVRDVESPHRKQCHNSTEERQSAVSRLPSYTESACKIQDCRRDGTDTSVWDARTYPHTPILTYPTELAELVLLPHSIEELPAETKQLHFRLLGFKLGI